MVEKLIERIPEFNLKHLIFISKRLISRSESCYLIGGCVRDLIMGKQPIDYDLTTSCHPEKVVKIFKKVIKTGIKHGTVTVVLDRVNYELTTFRKDIDYIDGRRPESVEFGISISEDLKRRDFTMNAIAIDLLSKKIIDEHNGILDIQEKLIRTIGDPIKRFSEDGLRPIRAIRFLSQLNFSIEHNTFLAIGQTKEITRKISIERFHDELIKILKSDTPSISIKILIEKDIFNLFLNNFQFNSSSSEQIKKIDKIEKFLYYRLAFLLYILKGNEKNRNILKSILSNLKFSNIDIKNTLFVYYLILDNYLLLDYTDEEIREYLLHRIFDFNFDEGVFFIEGFMKFYEIWRNIEHSKVEKFQQKIKRILEEKPPLVLSQLTINGNVLKKQFPMIESKKIGLVLNECLKYCFKFPNKNTIEDHFHYIKHYINRNQANIQ